MGRAFSPVRDLPEAGHLVPPDKPQTIMSQSRAERAREWVDGHTAAAVAAVVAAFFIPGTAAASLMIVEWNMAYHIGKVYKTDFDWHDQKLVWGAISLAGFAGQALALEAAVLLGPAGKGVVAAGIVKAMGETIIAHCEAKYPIPTNLIEEAPGARVPPPRLALVGERQPSSSDGRVPVHPS